MSVEATALTIEILKEIRDEIRQTNGRVDETNGRLDVTNARLDDLRDELGRRIVESETRTATAITDLAGTFREVEALLRRNTDLRPRVERCEAEIRELRRDLTERQ